MLPLHLRGDFPGGTDRVGYLRGGIVRTVCAHWARCPKECFVAANASSVGSYRVV